MTTAKKADTAAAEKAPVKKLMPAAPETGSAGQDIENDPSGAREVFLAGR